MVKIQLGIDRRITEPRSQHNRIYSDVDDITFKVTTNNDGLLTVTVEGKAVIPNLSPEPLTFLTAQHTDTEDTSRFRRFSTEGLLPQEHFDVLTLQSNSERVEFNVSKLKNLNYALASGFDIITFFTFWDDYLKFLRQCTTTEVDEIFRRYRLLLELRKENVEVLIFNAVMLEAMEGNSFLNDMDEHLFNRGLSLVFELSDERIEQVKRKEREVFNYKQDMNDMRVKMKEMHRLFFGDMYHFPVEHQTIEITLNDSDFESVVEGPNRTKYEPILYSLHKNVNEEHVKRDNYAVILAELINQNIDITNHYILDWWVYAERVDATKRRIVVDVLYLKPDTLLDMLNKIHPRYGISKIPRQNLKLDGHTIIPLNYAISAVVFDALRDKRDIHEERKQYEMTVEDIPSVFKLKRRNMKEVVTKTFIPRDYEHIILDENESDTVIVALGTRDKSDYPSFILDDKSKMNTRNLLHLGDMIYGYESHHSMDSMF